MKDYSRIFEYYIISFFVSLVVLALHLIDSKYQNVNDILSFCVDTILCSFPLLAFCFRKKYMYTRDTVMKSEL